MVLISAPPLDVLHFLFPWYVTSFLLSCRLMCNTTLYPHIIALLTKPSVSLKNSRHEHTPFQQSSHHSVRVRPAPIALVLSACRCTGSAPVGVHDVVRKPCARAPDCSMNSEYVLVTGPMSVLVVVKWKHCGLDNYDMFGLISRAIDVCG